MRDLHGYLDRRIRPAADETPARRGPDVLLDREGATTLATLLEGWSGRPPRRLLPGPEGGLEREEKAACLDAGFTAGSLGPRVLRFETAAVSALTVVGQALADETNPSEEEHGG